MQLVDEGIVGLRHNVSTIILVNFCSWWMKLIEWL